MDRIGNSSWYRLLRESEYFSWLPKRKLNLGNNPESVLEDIEFIEDRF